MRLLKEHETDAQRPLDQRKQRTLRAQLKAAKREVERLDALDSREVIKEGRVDEVLDQFGQRVGEITELRDELRRRQLEGSAWRTRGLHAQAGPLSRSLVFAARQLGADGLELRRGALDEAEAAELISLTSPNEQLGLTAAQRWEQLTDAERARAEALVGKAAGDEALFEQRRREQAAREKLNEIRKEAKRLPQAESLVAAVFAEEQLLFDGLRNRLRHDVLVTDEYGRQLPPRNEVTEIFNMDNVAALYLLLCAIGENGGRPVFVNEYRLLSPDLPPLPQGATSALSLNGLLQVRAEGGGRRIGYGPRVREIAARWGISLPAVEEAA